MNASSDRTEAVEIDFPGVAEPIPWNDGTGWVVHLSDLPRQSVQHGTGYAHFHDFALLHHADPAQLATDVRALLLFLATHADGLQPERDLARAADVFLGNCLNLAYDSTWISSPDLSIAGEQISLTIQGTALLLATHPEHREYLLTQLEGTPVAQARRAATASLDER